MARVRVHQHVNPLSPYYRQRPTPFDPAQVFADPMLPVHLDIGCARGRFILKMAEVEPDANYVGVEIREPLVDEANRIAQESGSKNLHYIFCNAMLWLGTLIEKIPDGQLKTVTIQFPDPWFKRKHSKRRMVNEDVVNAISAKIAAGGTIMIQTDIGPLWMEMVELFRENKDLEEVQKDEELFPVRTEREQAVIDKDLPIYRAIFKRKER